MSPYLSAFLRLLLRHPAKAIQIAWWSTTGRRVRARGHFRTAVAQLPGIYSLWLTLNQSGEEEPHLEEPLAIHLHLAPGQSPDAAIASVIGQSFERWQLYVTSADDNLPTLPRDPRVHYMPIPSQTRASGFARVLDAARTTHVIPLPPECVLTPGALAAFARAAAANGEIVLYADQDERGRHGKRSNPWLKPQWDEDLFLAQDYLSAACAVPVAAARRAGVDGNVPDALVVYSLLARLLTGAGALAARHVPYVAITTPPDAWRAQVSARAALVYDVSGVPVSAGPFGTLFLHRPLPDPPPRVSVIVPTRDRLDLLETCVKGVLHNTDYPDIELVIADNDSTEPETIAYFDAITRDRRVKVVRWPHPYNYSAINNFAATHASGAYLCLLNNDTEVTESGWLRAMMAHAVRSGIGAVGARLLYSDHSIQHAGVVIGMGNAAGHAHRGLPEGEPGWFAQALVTREVTAVTAACLVVARDKFEAVGGLDEQNLAIAYNDVDFCLKLRAAGWRNIYAADAVLIHHESKSRGLDLAPEHLARYRRELAVLQERWGTMGFVDPAHHPALDPASEVYRLRL